MQRLTSLGLTVRRPTRDDVEPIFRLQGDVDTHDYGSVDLSIEDVAEEINEVDLETDAWLVLDGERPLGYGLLRPRAGPRFRGHVAVHPDARLRGIGTALARLVEDRARERLDEVPGREAVTLGGWVNGFSDQDVGWSRSRGFEVARRFLRMRIDMTAPPPAPAWPDGVTVRTFEPGRDDRAMYDAQEEAFSDHWDHVTMPFDEWRRRIDRHDFDAGLWLMAIDGDRVVGTSTNSVIPENLGWISGLGVVRSHRRRGIARALLLQAFGDFWRRGQASVALGVDADSLTGATRLYESVGMRAVEAHDQVRKVLRQGMDA